MIHRKYRNGMTNLGVMCGFASNDPDGTLRIHQVSCPDMAFAFNRADGVRRAGFNMEPVTVIYRALPFNEGEQLVMEALHVCRMARSVVPKSFYWHSREWPRSNPFYPFREDRAGTLSDEVMAQLVDEHDLPDWVREAMAADEAFEEVLTRPLSNRRLNNRLLITGHCERVLPPGSGHGAAELPIRLRQGRDDAAFPITLNFGASAESVVFPRGLNPEAANLATIMVRPTAKSHGSDGDRLLGIDWKLFGYEVLAVNETDFEAHSEV